MLILIVGLTLSFNAKCIYQLMEDKSMNAIQQTNQGQNVVNKKENLNNRVCETCTPSFIASLLSNISNKLGLSLAIYQK